MQRILVIDRNEQPLMPCHPARARQLLKAGKARVLRRYPFTIMLTDREGGEVQPVALKADPGSRTTRLALVADFQRGKRVVWVANLHHRGQEIRDALVSRRQLRRSRRSRSSGNFNITTNAGTVQGISYRYCTHLHQSDGYSYEKGEALSSHRLVLWVSPRQNS